VVFGTLATRAEASLAPRDSPRAIRVQSEKRLLGGRVKGETICQPMSVRRTLSECHSFRGGCARSTLLYSTDGWILRLRPNFLGFTARPLF